MVEQTQEEYISQLEQEMQNHQQNDNYNDGGETIFNSFDQPNLIQWQLELDNILERIQYLLEGKVLAFDKDGNQVYEEPKDKSLIILNEYGVKFIMNVISFYLNRNTILSHYKPERINKILFDLGNKLADTIYINYEKMGMDSQEKKSRYPLLVLNILNTIESAYNRALQGGERESLRTARTVTQQVPMGEYGHMPQRPMGNKFSMFKPSTWL